MTMRCSGRKSTSINDELVRYATSARPGIGGTAARPPTLTKICADSSSRSPTRTVVGEAKRACPLMTVTFRVPCSHMAMLPLAVSATRSLRVLTRFMSTVTGPPTSTPYSAARRTRCAA